MDNMFEVINLESRDGIGVCPGEIARLLLLLVWLPTTDGDRDFWLGFLLLASELSLLDVVPLGFPRLFLNTLDRLIDIFPSLDAFPALAGLGKFSIVFVLLLSGWAFVLSSTFRGSFAFPVLLLLLADLLL